MEREDQYDFDDSFKKKARLHQTLYRENVLNVGYNVYGNRLKFSDAYLNYYPKLGVLEDKLKRYPNYSSKRDADMLRSEHIPFNVFSPLKLDFELAKNTFNKFLGDVISEITDIKIEFAPSPKCDYLNDGTSFDTYIEFTHIDSTRAALGIEVKYTEQAYELGENEKINIENPDSLYYSVTKKSELYIENATDLLRENSLRQVWRNHILGESIRQNNEIKHFISLTLYPSGNTHFKKVNSDYKNLLNTNKKDSYVGITFEALFDIYSELNKSTEFEVWVKYLKERYLVSNFI